MNGHWEVKVEDTPKKEKKFKYNRDRCHPVKVLLENGYKMVVWDDEKAYDPRWRLIVWS